MEGLIDIITVCDEKGQSSFTPGLLLGEGLALAKLETEDGGECLTVTHLATGMFIGYGFPLQSQDLALEYAESLKAIFDNTQGAQGIFRQMVTPETRRRYEALIESYWGKDAVAGA